MHIVHSVHSFANDAMTVPGLCSALDPMTGDELIINKLEILGPGSVVFILKGLESIESV